MSCKVNFKIKNKLEVENIIKGDEILSLNEFERYVGHYTKHAMEFYGLETHGNQLYEIGERRVKHLRGHSNRRDNYTTKFVVKPNMQLLTQLDDLIDNYNYNHRVTGQEESLKKISDLLDEGADNFLNVDVNYNTFDLKADPANTLFTDETAAQTVNVLNTIREYYGAFNEATQDILDKLGNKLNSINATVRYVDASYMEPGTVMKYDVKANQILISKEVANMYSLDEIVQSFLHESVHAMTADVLRDPRTFEEQMFVTHVNKMFESYKSNPDAFKEAYGFTNLDEFLAELMTNPAFQTHIKLLDEVNNTSLWRDFVDFIRTLLGLPKKAEYNNIVDSIVSIMRNPSDMLDFTDNTMLFKKADDVKDYDLSTTSKKLTKLLNDVKDNIEENIRVYDKLIRTSKSADKIKGYKKKLAKLLKDIERMQKVDEWKSLSLFVDQLEANISNLERRFDNQDLSKNNAEYTVYLFQRYLTANSLIEDVSKFFNEYQVLKDNPLSKEELADIKTKLSTARGKYAALNEAFDSYMRDNFVEKLSNPKYALEVEKKWIDKLAQEHKELNILEDKDTWITRQLTTTYKDDYKADIEEHVRNILESPAYDISYATMMAKSSINTNSKLVQILQAMLNELKDKMISIIRDKDFELRDLHDKFIKTKTAAKPSEIYKNLYEFSSSGQGYLKGEFSIKFKDEYDKRLAEFKAETEKILEQYSPKSAEYQMRYQRSNLKKWIDANTEIEQTQDADFPVISRVVPIEKWRNDLSKLSEIEVEVLEQFKKITEDSNKDTFGINSLKSKPVFAAQYYKLPSITKGKLEHTLEGSIGSSIKDSWKDLTDVRPDDVGYEVDSDMSGKQINHVKVHYRGKLDKGQQSLDLFNLYRLEFRNAVNFKEKTAVEKDMNTLLHIAKDKDYYQTSGNKIPLLGKFINRNKKLVTKSRDKSSNTYLKMKGMIESNIYDSLHKNAGKLGVVDINKAVRTLNGWTAKVGMSLNEVTATTNVLNGKAQLFLEAVAGNVIKGKSIAKAEKIYMNSISDLYADIKRPVKTSFINQMNEVFDTEGVIAVSAKQAFIKNTLLKSSADLKSLQFMQDTGEHWMQSVLTMGVLDSIQVMNEKGEFIDKDGKVVTKEKAASLLDMLEMVDGKLQVSPLVIYTTKNRSVKYNEGGKELVNNLIKKKLFDNFGNYDANLQPEAMRHATGKLLMMYRKFLIPMGVARYRGFAYFTKDRDDLLDHQSYFSDALQDYEEGFYTSFMRFAYHNALPAIKRMEFQLLSTEWSELSDNEKANIRKAVTEIILTSIIIPTTMMLLSSLLSGDDDDNEGTYFMLLQLARLESELASFRNPNEQYRILNNPIPAVNVLKSATTLAGRLVQPWNLDERYDTGKRKGQLKIRRNIEKMVPVLNTTNISYEEKFQFITNVKLY